MLALLNIGFFEMVLLAAAAVLLFGGDLPDVARKAARFVGKLRAMSQDLTREFQVGDDLRRPPGLRRPPELDRPRELDLNADERRLFDGKLTERPRTPFGPQPDQPTEAELGPPRTTDDQPTSNAAEPTARSEGADAPDPLAPPANDADAAAAEPTDGSEPRRDDEPPRNPLDHP